MALEQLDLFRQAVPFRRVVVLCWSVVRALRKFGYFQARALKRLAAALWLVLSVVPASCHSNINSLARLPAQSTSRLEALEKTLLRWHTFSRRQSTLTSSWMMETTGRWWI
jgi:hypothetical protein